jgi:uncharacterized alpha-E superfamily protein
MVGKIIQLILALPSIISSIKSLFEELRKIQDANQRKVAADEMAKALKEAVKSSKSSIVEDLLRGKNTNSEPKP